MDATGYPWSCLQQGIAMSFKADCSCAEWGGSPSAGYKWLWLHECWQQSLESILTHITCMWRVNRYSDQLYFTGNRIKARELINLSYVTHSLSLPPSIPPFLCLTLSIYCVGWTLGAEHAHLHQKIHNIRGHLLNEDFNDSQDFALSPCQRGGVYTLLRLGICCKGRVSVYL